MPLDTYYRRANWRLEAESPILVARATPVRTLPADFTKFRWPDGDASSPPLSTGSAVVTSATSDSVPDRLAAKLAAFSHSEFVFAKEEADRLLTVADSLALDHFGRSRSRAEGCSPCCILGEWTDLHRWFTPAVPTGSTRAETHTMWRRMNAAVIDDAMRAQDLGIFPVRNARVALASRSQARRSQSSRTNAGCVDRYKRRLLRRTRTSLTLGRRHGVRRMVARPFALPRVPRGGCVYLQNAQQRAGTRD